MSCSFVKTIKSNENIGFLYNIAESWCLKMLKIDFMIRSEWGQNEGRSKLTPSFGKVAFDGWNIILDLRDSRFFDEASRTILRLKDKICVNDFFSENFQTNQEMIFAKTLFRCANFGHLGAKGYRFCKFYAFQSGLLENTHILKSRKQWIKMLTYRHPFAQSSFAKSAFAKSLAKRAKSASATA